MASDSVAVWSEGLRNDGTYEYTTTSDCDGTLVGYLRRLPERRSPVGSWVKVDAIPRGADYPVNREAADHAE